MEEEFNFPIGGLAGQNWKVSAGIFACPPDLARQTISEREAKDATAVNRRK